MDIKKGIKDMMKEMKTGTYIKGEETFNFDFYTDLTTVDKMMFVNSVTDILIDDENYNFIIRDLIFDYFIVDIFTDVDTYELENSDDFISDAEQFLEETNIAYIVKSNIREGLIDELNRAVDLNLEYRTGIHINSVSEALTSLVNTLERKVKEFDFDGMTEIATKLSGMTDELTMDNLIKAYTSTDMFKNNMKEIEEQKKLKNEFYEEVDNVINISDKNKK